jgi:hypothetical protein
MLSDHSRYMYRYDCERNVYFSVPSGASSGIYEGHGGPRYMSKDVPETVKNVTTVLADAAMGMDDLADQRAIVAPADLARMLRHWYSTVRRHT